MKPIELHVYDFDGSLYDSPRPRKASPDWWYSARSLDGYGPPGFDQKWILGAVLKARGSLSTPWVKTVLLTGRPAHKEMDQRLREMLRSASLPFRNYQLKPVWPPSSTPRYKARAVMGWLEKHPTITKVIFYDDEPENLRAVGEVVLQKGADYAPVLMPGVT